MSYYRWTVPAAVLFTLASVVLAQTREKPRPNSEPSPENAAEAAMAGDRNAGRDVFRFETFGNEGFWTDAMRLPQGMEAEKFTMLKALEAGVHFDSEVLGPRFIKTIGKELKTDGSPKNAPTLNDPKTMVKLVELNAVIGVIPKDSSGDGRISIADGDKVGISCAICHTITDQSVGGFPGKGSIGRRLDGRATHSINMGALLALAANSRAYYPNLQLELGGKTIGRAPKGIRPDSTEAEVDAYLKNPKFYPVGTFDETADGIGNPVQNTPLFRQDLAGPYGSNGLHEKFEGISNASYTTNLDLSTLATPEGRTLLMTLAGKNGEELHANYVRILEETGVEDYPFVNAGAGGKAGHRDTPVARQVDEQMLFDLKAYAFDLPAPKPAKVDLASADRGREAFQANCAQCHNADVGQPVSTELTSLADLWPGYQPAMLAKRKPPLSPIEDSPGGFDDKMVIIDASERGEIRGVALPLLLDLARKPAFLHDNSVGSLDDLLDPQRGAEMPHPFFIDGEDERVDVATFLKGLGTDRRAER